MRLAGLLLSVLLTGAPVLVPPDAAAGLNATGVAGVDLAAVAVADPAPGPAAEQPPATITLTELGPTLPRPGGRLVVRGTLRNTGREPLRTPYVRLRVSVDPLRAREHVSAVAAGDDAGRDGSPVRDADGPRHDGELAPGATMAFALSVPVDDLGLDSFGVYVLGIEGREPLPRPGRRIAITRTFLPWSPADAGVVPTRVAWLWPVADRPHRGTDGTFLDDGLAGALRRDGRLGGLVAAAASAGAATPLTWVVDPMLLDDATAMAAGYRVRPGAQPGSAGTGRVVDGTGGPAAPAWLAEVRAATRGRTVVPLPYAGVDAAALTHGRRAPDVVAATRYGVAAARRSLPAAGVRSDIAWPAGSAADEATLQVLSQAGARAAVVTSAALPLAEEAPATPSGRGDLPGGLAGLLADERLSMLASAVPASGSDLVLARQRWLAETAMITAESPSGSDGQGRTVLVAPSPRWSPSADWATFLLAVTSSVPWLQGTDLPALLREPVGAERGPLRYTAEDRRRELPVADIDTVSRLRAEVSRIGAVLTEPGRYGVPYALASWRLASAAWRTDRSPRQVFVRDLSAVIRRERSRVRVLPGTVTLASDSGRIPVTVVNDLDQPVRVQVLLSPRRPALEVLAPEPVTIGARRKQQVLVPAEAAANGVVFVDARLQTPAGRPYGSAVPVRVRISDYGTIGTYVTGAAAAVLFGAAAVRTVRRIRASRRPPVAPAPGR